MPEIPRFSDEMVEDLASRLAQEKAGKIAGKGVGHFKEGKLRITHTDEYVNEFWRRLDCNGEEDVKCAWGEAWKIVLNGGVSDSLRTTYDSEIGQMEADQRFKHSDGFLANLERSFLETAVREILAEMQEISAAADEVLKEIEMVGVKDDVDLHDNFQWVFPLERDESQRPKRGVWVFGKTHDGEEGMAFCVLLGEMNYSERDDERFKGVAIEYKDKINADTMYFLDGDHRIVTVNGVVTDLPEGGDDSFIVEVSPDLRAIRRFDFYGKCF
ncbi:hypothetical protein KKC94_02845 [Patescibacteria group bacterium]|nr:hypothetical protein [Patescibacteria group bacterium]